MRFACIASLDGKRALEVIENNEKLNGTHWNRAVFVFHFGSFRFEFVFFFCLIVNVRRGDAHIHTPIEFVVVRGYKSAMDGADNGTHVCVFVNRIRRTMANGNP